MPSYPAAKRSGQTETLMYAERERLYDRGLDRDQMNSLMARLQARLGSKNKLGEAVYQRKNAASRIKQVMDGAQRYTDTVIDRIVEIARQNDVPLLLDTPSDTSGPPHETPEDNARTAAASDPGTNLLTESSDIPKDRMAPPPSLPVADISDDRVAPPPPLPVADIPDDRVAPPPALPVADVQEDRVAPPPALAVDDGANEDPICASPGAAAPAAEDWLAGVRGRREQIMRQIVDHEEALAARRAEIVRIEGEIERIAARRDADAANIGEIDRALSVLQTI